MRWMCEWCGLWPQLPWKEPLPHAEDSKNPKEGPRLGLSGQCPQGQCQQRQQYSHCLSGLCLWVATSSLCPWKARPTSLRQDFQHVSLFSNTVKDYHHPNSFTWNNLTLKAFHPSPAAPHLLTSAPGWCSHWPIEQVLSLGHPTLSSAPFQAPPSLICPHLPHPWPLLPVLTQMSVVLLSASPFGSSGPYHQRLVQVSEARRLSYTSLWMLDHPTTDNTQRIFVELKIVSCLSTLTYQDLAFKRHVSHNEGEPEACRTEGCARIFGKVLRAQGT